MAFKFFIVQTFYIHVYVYKRMRKNILTMPLELTTYSFPDAW